jgi:flagellar assembly protein FliH
MIETSVLTGEIAGAAQVWNAPSIEAGSPDTARRWQAPSDIEVTVYTEARAQGRSDGLAQAQAEIDASERKLEAQSRLFESALAAIARPLALMDTQLREQLSELAVSIARQLLRRELKTDPSQVIAVVRDTVALLPAAARDVRVLLHPEDAALLRERLAAPHAESVWTVLEDPVMSRGGCRVTADAAQIDARIETRLAAVMSALLGEERALERARERADAPPEELP